MHLFRPGAFMPPTVGFLDDSAARLANHAGLLHRLVT